MTPPPETAGAVRPGYLPTPPGSRPDLNVVQNGHHMARLASLVLLGIAIAGGPSACARAQPPPLAVSLDSDGILQVTSGRHRASYAVETGGAPVASMRLLAQGAAARSRWIVVDTSAPSRTAPSGECAAGEERQLVYLALDPALKIIGSSATLYTSCWRRLEGPDVSQPPELRDGSLSLSVACGSTRDPACEGHERFRVSFSTSRPLEGVVKTFP